jgi:hypothetical protein
MVRELQQAPKRAVTLSLLDWLFVVFRLSLSSSLVVSLVTKNTSKSAISAPETTAKQGHNVKM